MVDMSVCRILFLVQGACLSLLQLKQVVVSKQVVIPVALGLGAMRQTNQ